MYDTDASPQKPRRRPARRRVIDPPQRTHWHLPDLHAGFCRHERGVREVLRGEGQACTFSPSIFPFLSRLLSAACGISFRSFGKTVADW